jgi:uncharacterized protein YidB (DUF937 family)
MGLLDSVLSALGNQPSGGSGDLLSVVAGLLAGGQGGGGGLGALIQRFEQGGLGNVMASWVGSGANLPISPEQLQSVLGSEQVQQLAQRLGMSHGDVLGQLAQMLPQAVDRVTPQGEVPPGGLGDMGSLLSALQGRPA